MEGVECVLCCETIAFFCNFGCGHGPICHLCGVKVDKQFNDVKCPICKEVSDRVFFSSKSVEFAKVQWKKASHSDRFRKYFFFQSPELLREVLSFEQLRCPIRGCRDSSFVFENYSRLKKHLHESHRKTYCDVCYDNNSLTLKEQRIYSEFAYHEHLHCGELLQNGQELYHPYCKFCNKNFYDQDKVMVHLKQAHERCDLCPPEFRTYYYKNYESLEKHFERSHYLCPNEVCRAQRYKAYFTKEELHDHIQVYHGQGRTRSRNLDQLLGFNHTHQNFKIKDNEGLDFKPQFVSLRHNIFDKLDNNIHHEDQEIDFRDFYSQALRNSKLDNLTLIDRIRNAAKNSKDQDPSLQEVDVFLPLAMTPLKMNDFYRIMKETLGEDFVNKMHGFLGKHQKITDYTKFARLFDRQFDNQVTFLYFFPLLIRCWPDEEAQLDLDRVYLRKLLQLHRSKPLHFINHKTHGQFLKDMFGTVKLAVKQRIQKKGIDLKSYIDKGVRQNYGKSYGEDDFALQREKVIQIIHVVSHIPTKEMIKFRWLFKLGISVKTWEKIVESDYDPARFKQVCLDLAPKHLAILFLYLKMAVLAIFNKVQFAVQKDQKNVNFLASFLAENKQLLTQFKINQSILTIGKQSLFQGHKKQTRALYEEDDFPSLTKESKATGKKKQEKKPPDQPRSKYKNEDDFPTLQAAQPKRSQKISFVKVESSKWTAGSEVAVRPQTVAGKIPVKDQQQFPTFEQLAKEQSKVQKGGRLKQKNQKSQREQQVQGSKQQGGGVEARQKESEFDPSMFIEKKKPLDPELEYGHRKKKKYSYKPCP